MTCRVPPLNHPTNYCLRFSNECIIIHKWSLPLFKCFPNADETKPARELSVCSFCPQASSRQLFVSGFSGRQLYVSRVPFLMKLRRKMRKKEGKMRRRIQSQSKNVLFLSKAIWGKTRNTSPGSNRVLLPCLLTWVKRFALGNDANFLLVSFSFDFPKSQRLILISNFNSLPSKFP